MIPLFYLKTRLLLPILCALHKSIKFSVYHFHLLLLFYRCIRKQYIFHLHCRWILYQLSYQGSPSDLRPWFICRKGRGTRDQIASICWIIEKTREFQKNIYFCFVDYTKAFNCVDHNKLWKILKEMGIPDYLTCLLRNLYAGQEATVRTGHGTSDWFQ